MRKGLLSVVAGNTPDVRGAVVDRLLRLSPRAVLLSVSIEGRRGGRPVVQRYLSGAEATGREASKGATGDPVVILRQDLLELRRTAGPAHVVLALPENVGVLPLMVELWRARVGSGSLGEFYDPAPVVVGVDPASFMADISCVHQSLRLWTGRDRSEPLTPAEAAARQVEAADALIIPDGAVDGGEQRSAFAALAAQLNSHALLLTPADAGLPESETPESLVQAGREGAAEQWQAQLEPVTVMRSRPGGSRGVASLLWQSRRPLHPERLADVLPTVMSGVVRGRGHLWLCSRPESVVTWRSAGPYLELREADRWLEAADSPAWTAASPQRRALASWFWDAYYGERRNEIVLTGIDLDQEGIRTALDTALLTDAELSLGRDGWTSFPDPLLTGADSR
ncbi:MULTISPECIES: GTP-binding protein [unclassified Streptomyces]|uniref:GTP-binding protein n=1 Tax=unclassified Streptomyces TaxID=2593676 RepID=UPI003808D00A